MIANEDCKFGSIEHQELMNRALRCLEIKCAFEDIPVPVIDHENSGLEAPNYFYLPFQYYDGFCTTQKSYLYYDPQVDKIFAPNEGPGYELDIQSLPDRVNECDPVGMALMEWDVEYEVDSMTGTITTPGLGLIFDPVNSRIFQLRGTKITVEIPLSLASV